MRCYGSISPDFMLLCPYTLWLLYIGIVTTYNPTGTQFPDLIWWVENLDETAVDFHVQTPTCEEGRFHLFAIRDHNKRVWVYREELRGLPRNGYYYLRYNISSLPDGKYGICYRTFRGDWIHSNVLRKSGNMLYRNKPHRVYDNQKPEMMFQSRYSYTSAHRFNRSNKEKNYTKKNKNVGLKMDRANDDLKIDRANVGLKRDRANDKDKNSVTNKKTKIIVAISVIAFVVIACMCTVIHL